MLKPIEEIVAEQEKFDATLKSVAATYVDNRLKRCADEITSCLVARQRYEFLVTMQMARQECHGAGLSDHFSKRFMESAAVLAEFKFSSVGYRTRVLFRDGAIEIYVWADGVKV